MPSQAGQFFFVKKSYYFRIKSIRKMKKNFLYVIAGLGMVATLTFNSCQKCKECQYTFHDTVAQSNSVKSDESCGSDSDVSAFEDDMKEEAATKDSLVSDVSCSNK